MYNNYLVLNELMGSEMGAIILSTCLVCIVWLVAYYVAAILLALIFEYSGGGGVSLASMIATPVAFLFYGNMGKFLGIITLCVENIFLSGLAILAAVWIFCKVLSIEKV